MFITFVTNSFTLNRWVITLNMQDFTCINESRKYGARVLTYLHQLWCVNGTYILTHSTKFKYSIYIYTHLYVAIEIQRMRTTEIHGCRLFPLLQIYTCSTFYKYRLTRFCSSKIIPRYWIEDILSWCISLFSV